jgi:predicted TIM-barrel fold metal-dependent hydrolase
MSERLGHLVVDADSHVIELPDMWADYVEPRFRDRTPRLVVDENGKPAQLIGEGLTGRIAVEVSSRVEKVTLEELGHRSGGWDPKVRLQDMDTESIDLAMLFPSMSFFVCEVADPELDAALCRAYNDWLADYCAADRARLFGVALLPLQDVEASIRELERCAERHGFHGAFFRPNPYAGRPIHHLAYERLWDCAQSLGTAISVHEGLSDTLPTLARDRFENPISLHACSHTFEQMAACLGVLQSGILERYPRLHFAFLESGSGWLPYWLDRIDGHFDTWRSYFPALTMKPSEYFRRQCFIACDPDDELTGTVVRHVGDECVVWASDYPHPDAHFPGTMDLTLESMKDIPDDARRKVLGENAKRLFGLPA